MGERVGDVVHSPADQAQEEGIYLRKKTAEERLRSSAE